MACYTITCWKAHGMGQQSWHSWLVGFMIGSWLVDDLLFRVYGMLKSPWHESENYGRCFHDMAWQLQHVEGFMAWRSNHGMAKVFHETTNHSWHVEFVMANQTLVQKDFSIAFVPAAASAKRVRLTCLFAWARQPGSYDFHRSMGMVDDVCMSVLCSEYACACAFSL